MSKVSEALMPEKYTEQNYYVSLVRSLIGFGICVVAPSELAVRLYAGKYLGRMWCGVYKKPEEGNLIIIGCPVHVDEKGEE